MRFNYQKIDLNLLKDLPDRTKDVILRRFGLETGKRETLESIGKSYGITRERVRQIEVDGILRLKPKLEKHQKIFQHFNDSLKSFGNLKKEDLLLLQLGGQKFSPHIFFLLTLSDQFERFSETKKIYSLWTIDPESLNFAQKVIGEAYNKLEEIHRPIPSSNFLEILQNKSSELRKATYLTPQTLLSYLEISKQIQLSPDGNFGLGDWPEINPRGVKDKAYLVFKKEKKPLHFTEVARQISPSALVQTVHNELIRDPRFVLVGRGLYALRGWGYTPGVVKDVIYKVLKETGKSLSKEEILKKVLKQRLVKKNTILLNLSNKKYFLRNSQGKYTLRND